MMIFSVLHSLENDANCPRSTKYLLKLVKDFLDEKNSDSPKSFTYHHIKTLLMEFFNTPISLSASAESLFFIRSTDMKTFLVQRGEAMRIFKCWYFLKEINNFLFTKLVASIIYFEYWFCTVT